MNPDNFLVEHCIVCDTPLFECKDSEHAKIREQLRKRVTESSFIKGGN